MKKNLLYVALATVAFASCSDDVVVDEVASAAKSPIAFNMYAAGNTRAVTETLTETLVSNGFKVTAVRKDATDASSGTVYFKDQTYVYTSASSNYDHVGTNTVYYWPNTSEYMDFFAIYPTTQSFTLATSNLDATVAYTAYGDDDFNEDVVTAKKAGESCSGHIATVADVPLTFGHIKNQVAFSFCTNTSDENLTATVKKVTVTYPNAGTYTYSTGAWTSLSYETTTPKEYYANTTGTAVDRKVTTGTQTYTTIGDALALIPAAAALTVKVEYTVTQTVNSTLVTLSDFTGTAAKSFTIEPTTIGKKYRYNVTLPTGLQPITFTATVTGWGDETAVAVAETAVQ